MSIRVEFYGVPRQRAGVASVTVDVSGAEVPLRDVLRELDARFPDLARDCFDANGFCRGYTASVDGQQFVSDGATRLSDGCSLLILSADAGG